MFTKQSNIRKMMLLCVVAPITCGCAFNRGMDFLSKESASEKQYRETKLNFAQVYENEGQLNKAETTLRSVLEEYPDDPRAKHRLGVVLVRQGETEEGLPLLVEAVAADGENVDLLNDVGYAFLLEGDFEGAEKFFRDAAKVSPGNERTLNNLGLAMGYQGRFEEAYSIFTQSMPRSEALANLGYIHSQRGEIEMALNRFNEALTIDPSLKTAADAMVQVYTLRDKLSKNSNNVQLASGQQDANEPVSNGDVRLMNRSVQE